MRQRVEFPLAVGGSVSVEVDIEPKAGREARAARPGDLALKAGETFESAIDRIRLVADVVVEKLQSLVSRPNEMEVEFGFKLSSEAGVVLTSVGAEANFQVTLKWVQKDDAGGAA